MIGEVGWESHVSSNSRRIGIFGTCRMSIVQGRLQLLVERNNPLPQLNKVKATSKIQQSDNELPQPKACQKIKMLRSAEFGKNGIAKVCKLKQHNAAAVLISDVSGTVNVAIHLCYNVKIVQYQTSSR
ncbi:hypothetical protein GJ496_006138 [Pomphorhynchus laevis]|nr:hypothetical protein GJ496_006138 [Pomphorhynchus laevis]